MKICYRGQQVFLKSAESQRKNKTAKRRSKFSQGTRYLPLTVVSRTKQFCLNKIGCEIIFDGRKIASVDSGKKVDIKINGLPHKIACLWTFADGNQTLTETFTIPYGVSSLKYETMRKIENSHLFTLKGLNLTTTPVGILMEDTRLREESNNLFRQKLNEMVQWYRTNNL